MAKESRGTSALHKGAEGWSKSSSASAQGAEAATWSRPLETPPRVGMSRPEPFPGAGPAPLRPPSDYRRACSPARNVVPVSGRGDPGSGRPFPNHRAVLRGRPCVIFPLPYGVMLTPDTLIIAGPDSEEWYRR